MPDTKLQVEVRQLDRGRPPSLLPFDTLLLPHPINPAWRRRIAEAHSSRYIGSPSAASTIAAAGDRVDETDRPLSLLKTKTGLNAGEESHEKAEEQRGHTTGAAAATISGVGRGLKVGFLGHDFDEHPTAHMIEGVFVWQKRLAAIIRETTDRNDSRDSIRQSSTSNEIRCRNVSRLSFARVKGKGERKDLKCTKEKTVL